MNSSTISPIQHITPPPCLVASPLQLQPTITQSTPACLLLPGGVGMIHTFLPDPVPALVPSCARIIAGFRVPILRLQSRTLSCH